MKNSMVFKMLLNLKQRYLYRCFLILFKLEEAEFRKRVGIDKGGVYSGPKYRKKVVFVVEYLTIRVSKIGRALNDSGFNVVVLCPKRLRGRDISIDAIGEWANEIVKFSCVKDLFKIIAQTDSDVIHYFTGWRFCGNAALLIKNRDLFPPIVVERYDILNGMYVIENRTDEFVHRVERYVLENSDGLVVREFSIPYLKDVLHIEVTENNLVLLDNVDRMGEVNYNLEDEELSLCYAGGYVSEREYPESGFACTIEFATICKRNKCHYHMYPTFWNEDLFDEMIKEEQNNDYFHLHYPVPNNLLIEEIKKYDYFCFPVRKGYLNTVEYTGYTKEKFKYAGSNKFFDAIAAGLPIISVFPEELMRRINEHGLVIPWTIDMYDFEYMRKNRKFHKEQMEMNRSYWLMDKRINDLIKLYERVII